MKTPVELEVPSLENIKKAQEQLKGVSLHTPLIKSINLSEEFNTTVYLKREDLQNVRSYKIRGAFNKIKNLSKEKSEKGIVCASAGNHAQGVAYSCRLLGIKGAIFMPQPTPNQKIKQVKMFGKDNVDVILKGDTFDDAYATALEYCDKMDMTFVHPFDDPEVIEGQGTVGLEILEDFNELIDFLLVPIGGGGLAAGVGTIFRSLSPKTKIIGVEPKGAPGMYNSLKAGKVMTLQEMDKFVDGAAVKRVGDKTFKICQKVIDDIVLVPEGKICTTILRLYNEEAIIVEPAGALTIAALDFLKNDLKGKNVVCVVSGSNNDITRTEEIKERSLLYEGLKHYFIINFPQRAGALKEFLNEVLGPEDDITHFEYYKKNNREKGPALVGIELRHKEDFKPLLDRMNNKNLNYEYINNKPELFHFVL